MPNPAFFLEGCFTFVAHKLGNTKIIYVRIP
nr:MAG TPA_asm: hypothetical protein [Bacteriophage sp.]